MELLNKLKLNSSTIKVGDSYKATFPDKSGTIAFTDDIEPLKTKTYQCPEVAAENDTVTWNLELEDVYQSTPFVQVFDGENKIVNPEVTYNLSASPQVLSISFDGVEKISVGEFSAVVTIPFSVTTTIPDTVVTTNTDQGISGTKNFTGTLQYNGSEVAKKSEIPSLTGYATEEFVANCVNAVEIPDVSSFITKDVDNLANYTTSTTLESTYAKKSDVDGKYLPLSEASGTQNINYNVAGCITAGGFKSNEVTIGYGSIQFNEIPEYTGTEDISWKNFSSEDFVTKEAVEELVSSCYLPASLSCVVGYDKGVYECVFFNDAVSIRNVLRVGESDCSDGCGGKIEIYAPDGNVSVRLYCGASSFDHYPRYTGSNCSILTLDSNNFVTKQYVDIGISNASCGVVVAEDFSSKTVAGSIYLCGKSIDVYTPLIIGSGCACVGLKGSDIHLESVSGGIVFDANHDIRFSKIPVAPAVACGYVNLATEEYVDEATKHLVTKSVQNPATEDGLWTITLENEYTSAPFVQVFNGENKIVYPSVKFIAPSSLELEFEGKTSLAEGEFTAVISMPFTSTVELDETVVTINSDQGISGVKNFTGTLQYKGTEVATVDNLSTVEADVKSYVDEEISTKIASVYRFKGDSAYASLPTNASVGDVYNLTTASGDYKIGDNVAWTGTSWDKLAATVDLSGYLTTSTASSTYLTTSTASSTYLTKTSASSTYATKTDALSKSSTTAQTIAGPVTFNGAVSVSSLEVDSLDLATLNISEEITVNDVAVSESIVDLQNKSGVVTAILSAATPTNGEATWEITINSDSAKTVIAPPNVVITDITGDKEKYILAQVEWLENKVYITFATDTAVADNTYKVYITNIQLS